MSWAFRGYFIRTDQNGLDFGYSEWNVHLDHSQIVDAKSVRIRWIEWGGMGWRMKKRDHIGYIISNGSGIEISTTIKDRSYTFNCDDPDTILMELKNKGVVVLPDQIQ